MSQSPLSPAAAPVQVTVGDRGDTLDLTLANGDRFRLPAERLRSACKCAFCVRARIDGKFPDRFDAIAITELAPIGAYAINIGFSDGHARGIYPWSYLLELRT